MSLSLKSELQKKKKKKNTINHVNLESEIFIHEVIFLVACV